MNRSEFIKNLMALAAFCPLAGLAESASKEARKGTRSMVIYFSHAGENYGVGNVKVGNTAVVAGMIAKKLGIGIWEIKEEDPYPIDYKATGDRAQSEHDSNVRPKFKGPPPDLSDVDTIYLGYPLWCYDCPMIIYSFLDIVNLEGKTIVPFCTHEGTGLGNTVKYLAAAYPKAKVLPEGFEIYGHVAQLEREKTAKKVDTWIAHG